MRSSNKSGGIGFFGLLAIVFITLKLIGKIDWPWWLVLTPVWIPIAIILFLIIFSLAICGIIAMIEAKYEGQ